ncbi:hypothetical protein AJ80_00453 [Polytolypa hystricis UAMH7299]|uniref:Ubiquitin-like protease family profile domain-containing protein n=1 Tax=Polytolypa hystricis (strain UAMH7299) TaxID=1447883 RepID=A0A2B7Z3U0_POLH7|nr:hypothetical protein AJ80_00453 [Polytolypa hystricis UAMH7299]
MFVFWLLSASIHLPEVLTACCAVTNEDIHTLKNDWLTDNAIAFWEEYLEREFLVNYQSSNIVLLRPSMSFMLLQTPDPTSLREALPDFSKTTHIFLPVNDCRNVSEAEGGTHWSLLLVSVVDGIAFHYDSLPPGNLQEAGLVTRKLSDLLNKRLRFINLDDSPVQENSSDCGVFVCLSMRHLLLKRLLTTRSSDKISMSLGKMKVDAWKGRKEMLRIIDQFRKRAERRRSYVLLFPSAIAVLLLAYVASFFFPEGDDGWERPRLPPFLTSLPSSLPAFSSLLSLPSSFSPPKLPKFLTRGNVD